MNLTAYLKEQGYDLISGPVRNHKLLQLWIKKIFDEIELYYSDVNHAFESNVQLTQIENKSLTITSSNSNEYSFNIGITVLDEILKSLGLINLDIGSQIKTGNKITISYDNAITREVPVGELSNYLYTADFKHPNPDLLKNANKNNIIIVSGIIYAKNLVVGIDSDSVVNAAIALNFSKIADGKIQFEHKGGSKIKMTTNTDIYFPIAIKANRLSFEKGKFKEMKLISDNRNLF
ncbi:hypothetical protein [Flavobacterium sp. H122]|uniref:gasdermin n=1 Tax=Flavobacterium sp. H122 TaxID=2529860 RepID=UPI0010AA8321|nr:hypothetical protein [Flavobacterium sp. H122]